MADLNKNIEEIEQAINDIQESDGTVKPIPSKSGLIAYRKYLWALHYVEKRIERLEEYKREIVADVNHKIEREREVIERIRGTIEYAMEVDPDVEKTKTGGRKLSLPDIATVSMSKVSDKIIIDDPDMVLQQLGKDFEKQVKPSLDVTKAKKHIEGMETLPDGVRTEKSRTLSVRFIS